jgi:hypothetical protein
MMNERIKELISDASDEVWGNNPYNGSPEFEGYELNPEKFAELIVRECAIVARNTDLEDVEGGDSAVLGAARDQILEHFGVVE